jgi:hypothetical protein
MQLSVLVCCRRRFSAYSVALVCSVCLVMLIVSHRLVNSAALDRAPFLDFSRTFQVSKVTAGPSAPNTQAGSDLSPLWLLTLTCKRSLLFYKIVGLMSFGGWGWELFAKLRKATVSFVMSVCPSIRPSARMEQLDSH